VISMTLADSSNQQFRVFYIRRALRLFPAYLLCLAVSAFVMLDASIVTLNEIPWNTARTAGRLKYLHDSQDWFWTHLALHVPLLHGVVPDRVLPSTSYAFIGQAWSLSLEWQFYLVAPFAFMFMRWFDWTLLKQSALLIVLALLGRRIGQQSMLPSNAYLFAVGYFSFQLYQRRTLGQLSTLTTFGNMTVWTAAAALVGDKWISVVMWSVVLLAITEDAPNRVLSAIRTLFCSRTSTHLGAISYSFYCCHMIAIFGVAYLLIHVLRVRNPVSYAIALIGSSLGLSLAIATALHVLVEKPCIALGRRAATAMRAKSRGAVANA
jgi:peptidoglycan/LPS O-acetylase OafA/YrhL